MKSIYTHAITAAVCMTVLGGLLLAADKPRLIDVAKKQAGCSENSRKRR